MSYEICYGRQFIKIDEERTIPLILGGSSNCTMFVGRKEILERHWFPLFSAYNTNKENLDYLKNKISSSADYDGEWFKSGSRWIKNSNILKWYESGLKSAYTIEEIVRVTHQSLYCCAYLSHKTEFKSTKAIDTYCKTTKEILDWLDAYKEYEKTYDKENYYCYMQMGFLGIEPLGMGKPIADNIPVVCKIGSGYVSDISDKHLEYSKDKKQAVIFSSKEEFELRCLPWHWSDKYTLVKADTVTKIKPITHYIISIEGSRKGYYVKKKTAHTVYFSYTQEYAKGFTSHREAERYIESKLQGFNSKFGVADAKAVTE